MKEVMILSGKIEVLNRVKKWTFLKGVSQWFLSKNQTFSYLRFSQKFYQKTTFLILWKEKNDFKWQKYKFLEGLKNGHFPRWLVHDFVQKS